MPFFIVGLLKVITATPVLLFFTRSTEPARYLESCSLISDNFEEN